MEKIYYWQLSSAEQAQVDTVLDTDSVETTVFAKSKEEGFDFLFISLADLYQFESNDHAPWTRLCFEGAG